MMQELEAADHTVPTVRREGKKNANTQLAFSFLFSLAPQFM